MLWIKLNMKYLIILAQNKGIPAEYGLLAWLRVYNSGSDRTRATKSVKLSDAGTGSLPVVGRPGSSKTVPRSRGIGTRCLNQRNSEFHTQKLKKISEKGIWNISNLGVFGHGLEIDTSYSSFNVRRALLNDVPSLTWLKYQSALGIETLSCTLLCWKSCREFPRVPD